MALDFVAGSCGGQYQATFLLSFTIFLQEPLVFLLDIHLTQLRNVFRKTHIENFMKIPYLGFHGVMVEKC